jgi:hypothetical protein
LEEQEYQTKRAELVKECVRIINILESQGDFPDKNMIRQHDENRIEIINLDTKWETQQREQRIKRFFTPPESVITVLERCQS